MSTCAGFAKTLPDRLRNTDNSLSSLTNGRFINNPGLVANTVDIYDYFNGAVNSTKVGDNAIIWANAPGKFTYNTLLSDLVGGFWSLNKDILLNESLYLNLYLNNACVGVVVEASGNIVAPGYKNFTTTSFFIKVAYQQSNAINMSIKQAIQAPEGLNIPFPYVSNFSFNDNGVGVHAVSLSLRIYNMIGNRLRRIYLIANNWAFTDTALQAGYSEIKWLTTVQFFIDSNLITQYDNTRYENLLNCKLWNKYWNSTLQLNNLFLPFYFYDQDKDSDNLNEGMPVNADTIISFICNNAASGKAASYNVYAEGVKNLVISRNGVAVV